MPLSNTTVRNLINTYQSMVRQFAAKALRNPKSDAEIIGELLMLSSDLKFYPASNNIGLSNNILEKIDRCYNSTVYCDEFATEYRLNLPEMLPVISVIRRMTKEMD